MKLLQLLDAGWCQGPMATDANGSNVLVTDPQACKFCLVGAMLKARVTAVGNMLMLSLVQVHGFEYISHFNDHPDTTFGMVRALVENYYKQGGGEYEIG